MASQLETLFDKCIHASFISKFPPFRSRLTAVLTMLTRSQKKALFTAHLLVPAVGLEKVGRASAEGGKILSDRGLVVV